MNCSLRRSNRELAPSDVFDEFVVAVFSHDVSDDDSQILLRSRMVLVDLVLDASSFRGINAPVLHRDIKTERESQLVLHIEVLPIDFRSVEKPLRALKLNLLRHCIAAQFFKCCFPHRQDLHFAAADGNAVGETHLISMRTAEDLDDL